MSLITPASVHVHGRGTEAMRGVVNVNTICEHPLAVTWTLGHVRGVVIPTADSKWEASACACCTDAKQSAPRSKSGVLAETVSGTLKLVVLNVGITTLVGIANDE